MRSRNRSETTIRDKNHGGVNIPKDFLKDGSSDVKILRRRNGHAKKCVCACVVRPAWTMIKSLPVKAQPLAAVQLCVHLKVGYRGVGNIFTSLDGQTHNLLRIY